MHTNLRPTTMDRRRPHWPAVVAALTLCLISTDVRAAMRVHRAEPGAGQTVASAFVDGKTGKPAAVQTRVTFGFDERTLRLHIECLEPNMAGLVVKKRGPDAYVFSDDCIELFICPTGSEKLYYHFAANAVGERFDEQVRNHAYNAAWTVKALRAADRWTLDVAIPFGAIGGKPGPGAVWWVNVCRQRQAGGKTELSAWSPTGRNFHSVAHFGRLVFESNYRACLARHVVEPWDRRVPRLRERARIDAAAARRLDGGVKAAHARLEPVRRAAKAGEPLTLDRFAALLEQGESALAALDEAEERLAADVVRLEAIRTMRRLAPAGAKRLVYAVRPITNRKVLPTPEPPEAVSRELAVRACRGEYEPASFVVYPFGDLVVDKVVVTDLKGEGAVLPASAIDVRTVKCWYQAGPTDTRFPFNKGVRLLTPELLLKDDGLVKVDHEKKHNYVKLSFPDGTRRWLWISNSTRTPEERDASADKMPIRDARTLQPVAIAKHTAKRFWVTVHVPDKASSGVYRGAIQLWARGRCVEMLPLTVEVLPFELEPNPLESSIYFHWGITLDVDGPGTVRHPKRNLVQYRAELANLLAHGVDNPTVGVRFKTDLLPVVLKLRQEVGLRNDHLYYLIAGTNTPTDQIRKIIAMARRFGYQDVYFYARDEAHGEKLTAQRPVWERVHKAGGKIFVAGSKDNFRLMGDLQDLMVRYGDPSKEEAAAWHGTGHKIFCYANPQSGLEAPETYRRNFGLLLDANDYDGGMTYIYYHGWNDFCIGRYRQHNFVYPTVDGVIDTVQWEGYREGIDDLRYLATLRKAIANAGKAGVKAKEAAAARKLVDAMDVTGDLDALRSRMIDHTVRLLVE